jgi:hypothetical protein
VSRELSVFHQWQQQCGQVPQGLKPLDLSAHFGTTEVVPCYKAIYETRCGDTWLVGDAGARLWVFDGFNCGEKAEGGRGGRPWC